MLNLVSYVFAGSEDSEKFTNEPFVLSPEGSADVTSVPGIFFKVVLVIVFGGEKFFCFFDFGDDGPVEELLRPGFGFFGDLFLFGRMGVDCRAVLGADIGALAVERGGVVDFPEKVEDFFVGDDFGIEFDADDFGVSGKAAADIAVGGVGEYAV